MRADGIKLKKFDPMYTVANYIMDKRYDAMNMITLDIPLEPLKTYLQDAKRRGHNVTHLGVILAAYVRTVAEFPGLNRFIVNRRAYAHKDFKVGMVVLKDGRIDEHGSMSKCDLALTDTIFQVQDKIDGYIQENRANQENNKTEKAVLFFLSVPGLVRVCIGLAKMLDRHGLLPQWIIDVSPFHCSLLITNLASIRTNHIYHHVYEFGTTSISVAMGNARLVPKVQRGSVVFERCMPLGVVMDERIASGSYFALAFRRMRNYLSHPELLETPPEYVVTDE